jgi:hypothetical protein
MSQIMKKSILTLSLFSMMMILTSFTSTSEIGNQGAPQTPGLPPVYGIGNQGAPQTPGLPPVYGNGSPLAQRPIGNQGAPQTPGLPTVYGIGNQGAPQTPGLPKVAEAQVI